MSKKTDEIIEEVNTLSAHLEQSAVMANAFNERHSSAEYDFTEEENEEAGPAVQVAVERLEKAMEALS